MSRPKLDKKPNIEFIKRFIEACGTAKAADIQRRLGVSYQSVKNYLNGRLPESEKLVLISDRTQCSIDWLLTGRGKKFIDGAIPHDTPLPTGQMEAFVRRICWEVINEFRETLEHAQEKVVVLQSSELMSEKVMDEAAAFTARER